MDTSHNSNSHNKIDNQSTDLLTSIVPFEQPKPNNELEFSFKPKNKNITSAMAVNLNKIHLNEKIYQTKKNK